MNIFNFAVHIIYEVKEATILKMLLVLQAVQLKMFTLNTYVKICKLVMTFFKNLDMNVRFIFSPRLHLVISWPFNNLLLLHYMLIVIDLLTAAQNNWTTDLSYHYLRLFSHEVLLRLGLRLPMIFLSIVRYWISYFSRYLKIYPK